MATRFSRSPSLRSVTVSEMLLHFRSTVSGEALNALEERDVSWRRENDVLREEYRTIDAHYSELLLRSRWMEEELSKQTCMRRSLEEDIECFTEKERWLQAKVRSLEADVLNLGRAKKEELDRVSKEKAFLEAQLHEAGLQLSKQQSLIRTIDVMKKEIDDFEYALGHVKLEKNERTSNYKVIEERQGRAVRASGVSQRVQVLEMEKKELQAAVSNVKKEKSDDIRSISIKKIAGEAERRRRLEEKEKMKIQELNRRVEALEREKGEIEAELRRAESARNTEIEMILNEKMDLEIQNRRTEEEMEKISQLANEYDVLETEKGEIEAELFRTLHEKVVLGGLKSRMEAEFKEKMSELVNRIEVLETEKGEIEAELCKANQEKNSEIERIMKEKMALEVEKRTAEGRINVLEVGRRHSKMANQEKQQLIKKIQKEKMNLEAEMRKVEDESKLANKERQQFINKILKEKTSLQAEMRKAKEQNHEKISDLVKRIEVLVRETKDMEAQVCKAKTDKKNESERLSMLKEALEDQKSRMEEIEKQVSENLKTIKDLEREKEALEAQVREKSEVINKILKEKKALETEKRTMEDEDKKVLELNKTIDGLKRERTGIEAKLCRTIEEKSEEMRRILKEKTDLEAEKRIMEDDGKSKFVELNKIIEVLKREKRETEAEFCQANKEKSEEMKRILNEKIAVRVESLELASRIDILEREKRGLEAEITDKDEVIKVVAQENSCLENVIKKLNMELLASKSKEEEVRISQPVHHPGNVGLLTTPWQTEGACKRKRTNVSKSKSKRKQHFSEGSSGGRCSGIVNASSGGEAEDVSENRKPAIWEVEEDLLAAFEGDPELCLKAVCALYRQHLLVADPANTTTTTSSPSHSARGFKPGYSNKAVALAEYLVDEDPEVRLRKTVADLEQLDPLAVAECRDIAKQHYKQLFQMHTNNKDPSFLS
ncbi:hypothetical protein V2J09_017717 [Rumex salicifolius]